MNREEQRRALEGILDALDRARGELDDAVSRAHSLRDEADEGSPFDEDYLDGELCVAIEGLCDDTATTAKAVEGMLDDLTEDEDEEDEP